MPEWCDEPLSCCVPIYHVILYIYYIRWLLFLQIYGYRMSLWGEHLGMLDETFEEPERLECVHKVNKIADNNWKLFASEDFSLLQGHLLKYPVQVDSDGKIRSLPDCENFPDAGGKILGAHSTTIPDILTT